MKRVLAALLTLALSGCGRSGTASPDQSNVPVPVAGLGDVAAIAAGASHGVALAADGAVWAWGSNLYRQLGAAAADTCGGFGSRQPCSRSPRRVPGPEAVTAVAAGANHTLALARDGSVWGWGWSNAGQVGDGGPGASCTRDRCEVAPTPVADLANVVAIAAGGGHSLALAADGTVYVWGRLGGSLPGVPAQPCDFSDAFGSCSTVPVRALGPGAAGTLAAGDDVSLVLAPDGSLRAWGSNWRGGLGAGLAADSATPVPLPNLPPIRAVAAGAQFGLALTTDHAVWAWGDNILGQLGR